MPAKSVLEALDEGIARVGVATPPSEDPPQDDPPADDPPADDELPNDEPAEDDPPADDPPADDEPGEDDPPADDEPADEPEETPEAKAEREAAEKLAARTPPDHVNDPIPEGLTKRSSERMQFLANEVKALKPRAEQGDELISHINASNMTADEFGMALTFGRLKHSDNVEDNRKAYQILWAGLKELAPIVGETLPGVDPLEGHPDLQARVTAKTIDAKDAAEIAAGRNRRKADATAQTRASQNQQAAQTRAEQDREANERVRLELNDLGKQLAATDPQFEAKMRLLSSETKANIKNAPPGLRVNAFLKAFLAVKVPAKPAAGAVMRKPGQQPMRAGKVPAAGNGGVKREAKSATEAIDFALGLR